MAAPAIGKVLHAARQDLEVLGPPPEPLVGLFDTQVAAALIGLPAQVGYGELVQAAAGRQPAQGRDAHRLVAPAADRAHSSRTRSMTCAICCRCASG